SFSDLPENAWRICEYVFTEMFNNALDHSEGQKIFVNMKRDADLIDISVGDDGVGIFKKIKDTYNFEDERESALQLSKGKLTTEPENHSGEGIFFTSRAVDQFFLYSFGLCYAKDTLEDDWFVETKPNIVEGTVVNMIINSNTPRVMKEVFDKYSNSETHKFDKTHIVVALSRLGEERFISRSQAKRILWGVEKFKHVILDFKGVTTVGQGFVDEVFRVYKSRHPEINIKYENANEDVTFMIERGLPEINS
ncbi:MAG: STAS-like domain-containing protein, partial [Nitrospinales bacterium]